MIGIIAWLLMFLSTLTAVLISFLGGYWPEWTTEYEIGILCTIVGGYGGVLYCLRGVYLNYSVKKQWGKEWYPWYVLRPIVALISGTVSYLFLQAGLLVLEAQATSSSSNIGYYALAFIAGLNVDKFINKIEELAQATWGIEKSRASKDHEN